LLVFVLLSSSLSLQPRRKTDNSIVIETERYVVSVTLSRGEIKKLIRGAVPTPTTTTTTGSSNSSSGENKDKDKAKEKEKGKLGVETQYRMNCRKCGTPLAYSSVDFDQPTSILYVFDGLSVCLSVLSFCLSVCLCCLSVAVLFSSCLSVLSVCCSWLLLRSLSHFYSCCFVI
jgi:hypothetical protein